MIKEALARCLNTEDPAQSLRGFLSEISRYKYSEPTIYNGVMKKAVSLIGADFLVDTFANSARDEDVALIQAIEKKASDQKITRDEILNYLQQGGVIELLDKKAFVINSHLEKYAGIGDLVAPVKKRMGMASLTIPPRTGGALAKAKMGAPRSPAQLGSLPSSPKLINNVSPPGTKLVDPMRQ